MRTMRTEKVEEMIDPRYEGCTEIGWTTDLSAYAVTSVVVAFLLTVFTLILPAAA